ncbi:trehalose-phosphatase [Paracoccus laeviglucosivorans]|uniref:trehalose-phosphatase n=1 Tax=Paracoccus laeviglucosivorans TaxID=1197861 RepID=UPI00163D92BA|nr:trehalose-phosphatase [Paracoccus laeviglucosivorans]
MKDTALQFGSLDLDRHAFFFDFDGTLAELVDDPADVRLADELRRDLLALSARTNGAVAIITGRHRAEITPLLGDIIPIAGLHGTDFPGDVANDPGLAERVSAVRPLIEQLTTLVEANPGTILEDKGQGLALHWRAAPDKGELMTHAAEQALATLGPRWRMQPGKCVAELRPVGDDKGVALHRFMALPAFAGRRPVAFGDDLNDLPMLQAARDSGGLAIALGERNLPADLRLPGPSTLAAWLAERLAA